MNNLREFFSVLVNRMRPLRLILLFAVLTVLIVTITQLPSAFWKKSAEPIDSVSEIGKASWIAPDTAAIPETPEGDLVRYGRKLIANTAYYLGPEGISGKVSNSMNCQNCHINAGSKPYGNSFAGVASMYPVFRARSGIIESIEFRINDCMQRSMNGQMLDTAGTEMRAMVAYLEWIGKDVPKKTRPEGTGTVELTYLKRAADPIQGKIVYETKCKSCHGKNGEGIRKPVAVGFIYPPLWGKESYNTGAGLFRLSRFAGFVKYSMPLGTQHDKPQLTDEEAWDVAAFVNSMPRPEKNFPKDWPVLVKKAVDFPFGPYADNFSETDHKYGPFGPIKEVQDSMIKKINAGH